MNKASRAIEIILFSIYTAAGASFLIFPEETAKSVSESMYFTAKSVIPALFPFMVISKLIESSVITDRLIGVIRKPFEKLFGISKAALTAVILGFISGFPIGALTVNESYKNGRLSKAEAERAVALSHNTGPSFPIGLVGTVLWNDKAFGIFLYTVQLVSWMITARLYKSKAWAEIDYSDVVDGKRRGGIAPVITGAISDSAMVCVRIMGFTAFLRICSGLLVSVLPKMPFSAIAIMSSAFEFSDGCVKAASLGGMTGCAVTGFSIGFGGLSALLQGASVTLEEGLSVKPLITAKLFEGALCAVFSALYYRFVGVNTPTKPAVSFIRGGTCSTICVILLFIIFSFTIKNSLKPSKNSKTS